MKAVDRGESAPTSATPTTREIGISYRFDTETGLL